MMKQSMHFSAEILDEIANVLANAFVNGVYGGGIHHLSIKSCSPFNYIKQIEMEHGSYFVGGIKKMIQSKVDKLNHIKDQKIPGNIEPENENNDHKLMIIMV